MMITRSSKLLSFNNVYLENIFMYFDILNIVFSSYIEFHNLDKV